MNNEKNIILIGMPSSGKSTTGKVLAQILNKEMIDTDKVISDNAGRALRDIVISDGLEYFLKLQETEILKINNVASIISTGGGVIYSDLSMKHLKKNGIVFFLDTPFQVIEARVTPERRFARTNGQSLLDIYNERVPIYNKYCDFKIECNNDNADKVAQKIIKIIENQN